MGKISVHKCFNLLVHTDHYKMVEGKMEKHPVIDYQAGSLRDDFDFGSLWCIKAQALADYIAQSDRETYQFAALYDLRLYLSRVGEIFHLNEFLYSEAELDTRKSGEKQFDYVEKELVLAALQENAESKRTIQFKPDRIGKLVDIQA